MLLATETLHFKNLLMGAAILLYQINQTVQECTHLE